jgi:hypothetical protein
MIANLSGTPSRLCQAAIGNSSTTLYTAKSDGKTAILDAQICNTTSAAKTVRLCIGSISTSTALLYDVSIAPNSIIQIDGFQILNANEVLVASASDTGLTITISGLERV